MKRNIFIETTTVFAFLFFSACNSPKENKMTDAQLKATDLLAKNAEKVITLCNKFKTKNVFPYEADTTFLYKEEKNSDSLGTNEIKQLDVNWFKHDLIGGTEYDMKQFYIIDSVKTTGTYASWCDSLQPGNTKRSNAYAVCKLLPDSFATILVWTLMTSSYEACPYSSSKAVYITVVYNGSVTQSFLLGEYISAGDPPVSMHRTVTGKITADKKLEIHVYEEDDEDMDLPEIKVTKEHYEFEIKEGKINLIKEKKEKVINMKKIAIK
ncbi:MAG TPA: hypothetical protein VNZ49_08030 [Bacteroidia bacterium]|jgi:hypothetical protein|nr:hypothetical protein [Bacteroidia bacterium]